MRYVLLFIVLMLISGCATAPKSTNLMTHPKLEVIQNERSFNIPYDEVWQYLVSSLSKSFFVINNISKESNFISVSFSAQDAENYVDCGTRTTTYEGNTNTYEVAGTGFFKIARQAGSNAFYVDNIKSDAELEGRINVYVAPLEHGAKVSVNVKYIVTVSFSGTTETFAGALLVSHGTQEFQFSSKVSFNTNQKGEEGKTTCVSNGRLETMILDMVQE